MKLDGKSKHKLAIFLQVKLMSWFSKEDLDMIIKTYEATSNTSFRALFTIYNFALFLIDKYEAHFDTEPGLIEYVKIDLDDLLKTIKFNLAISKMLNDK